jgi:hypothetical protein
MYAGLQNTVEKLFTKFGQEVDLYKTVEGSFDPETGTDSTSQTHQCKVLAVFVGIKSSWGMLRGAGSFQYSIQEGDSIVLVAPTGGEYYMPPASYFLGQDPVPEQNDLIDGWTILAVEKVKPAATTVLYKCHVRKQ